MILVNIMKAKRKTPTKKPSGIPRLVRLPPDLDAWLVEKTEKDKDAYYVQETIRNILKAARDADLQAQAA